MSSIVELFGVSTAALGVHWPQVIAAQQCAYTARPCYKTRKSQPEIAIGTCTVAYGRPAGPVIICPNRLLENQQIFQDAVGLLAHHQQGNELHVVPEVSIPGGSVDFFLVSARGGQIVDFVGIELQTLDTTGTVWPERQRALRDLGVPRADDAENSGKPYGMNWKMTAKTILMQMHHKVQTFEHVGRKIVLVIQDCLLNYMAQEFRFGQMHAPALPEDSMIIHSYRMMMQRNNSFTLRLDRVLGTNADGIAAAIGLQAEARIELEVILENLASKMGPGTYVGTT